jgi:exosortase
VVMTSKARDIIKDRMFLIVAGLTILIYLPAIIDLISDWWNDPNYSHGFLIPIISFYLIWRKKGDLADIKTESSRFGLAIIICGIILFVLGNGASEYFTVRLSLVIILFGLVLYHFGKALISKIWFALLFLVFMIPIPYVLYFSVAFPLQILASKITVTILNGIGMTVIRQGNIIILPNQVLEVAGACSGMRSLVSLLALGAIYAYLTQKKLPAQVILFLATVPIAVAGNVFRVLMTTLIVYLSDLGVTEEPMHSIMGASVFVIAFIMLFIFGAILRKLFK